MSIRPSRGLMSRAEAMQRAGKWKTDEQKAAEHRRALGVPFRCQDCRDGIHVHRGPLGCLEAVQSAPRDFICKCNRRGFTDPPMSEPRSRRHPSVRRP